MNEVIVQFAVLWGQTIGSAFSVEELDVSRKMKEYESGELLDIFSAWAEEAEERDPVEFFEEKLKGLLERCTVPSADESQSTPNSGTNSSCTNTERRKWNVADCKICGAGC